MCTYGKVREEGPVQGVGPARQHQQLLGGGTHPVGHCKNQADNPVLYRTEFIVQGPFDYLYFLIQKTSQLLGTFHTVLNLSLKQEGPKGPRSLTRGKGHRSR